METTSTSYTPDPAQAAYLHAYLDKALDKALEKALDERLARHQAAGHSDDLFSQVQSQISKELGATLEAFVQRNEQRSREFSLLERMVRVEEELKALRETEAVHFAAMNDRFDSLMREMKARSETVDKRFEAVDKRFTVVLWAMGIGFSATYGLLAALVVRLG